MKNPALSGGPETLMDMMHKPQIRIVWLVAVLATGALSCNLPSVGATDIPADDAGTAIAGTVAARVAQTSAAEATETEPTVLTPTEPSIATATLPETQATATPELTATPAVPLVSVSVNTNCRTGPSRVYDYVGALLVGETEEVVALSTVPNYWYITNPDRPGEFCYLWGEYATIAGDTQALPEFTPLPSPTATNTPTPSDTPTPTSTPTPTP